MVAAHLKAVDTGVHGGAHGGREERWVWCLPHWAWKGFEFMKTDWKSHWLVHHIQGFGDGIIIGQLYFWKCTIYLRRCVKRKRWRWQNMSAKETKIRSELLISEISASVSFSFFFSFFLFFYFLFFISEWVACFRNLSISIFFLQVWWCGGSEEKTRAEGKEGEEREKGEERRGRREEERGKGKRRKEAWAEEKKWKKWVKELKLEIEKNTHAGRKKGKFKTTFKV